MNGKYVLFDIGANFGIDSLDFTYKHPQCETWAFEPTPELAANLRLKSSHFSNRYHVIEAAVSDFDGTANFNIAATSYDWGCSSLNDFNDDLHLTWPGRNDLKTERQIVVNVCRLDNWFKNNHINIPQIDYFHCDTQGSDLRVLVGMGPYVNLIVRGVVECPNGAETSIYKQNHSKEEMIDFLLSNGFVITKIIPNDHFGASLNQDSTVQTANEINVFFEKRK